MTEYVIKEILPKSGKMREIHSEILGCRCYIIFLEKGKRGFIRYEPQDEHDEFYCVHTSSVLDYSETEEGSRLTIETRNTTYVLERIDSAK